MFKNLIDPETKISNGLMAWLKDYFKASEEARSFFIKDLGDLGKELPNIQIEPAFELVGLGDSFKPQKKPTYELRLSWKVDEISLSYANGLCVFDFGNSIQNTITVGLLPKDGYFTPATRTILIKNFPLVCLPEEIHAFRQVAHQNINACFNAAVDLPSPSI